MTDAEKIDSEIDAFRHMILGVRADACLDAGDAGLAGAYLWLRDNNKWPGLFPNWGGWDWTSQSGAGAASMDLPEDVLKHIPDFDLGGGGPVPEYRKSESICLLAAAEAVKHSKTRAGDHDHF